MKHARSSERWIINKPLWAGIALSLTLHAAGYLGLGRAKAPPHEVVEVVLYEVKGNSDRISVHKTEILRAVRPVKIARPVAKDDEAPALSKSVSSEERREDGAVTSEDSAAGDSEIYGTADGREVSAQERYRLELQAMLEKKKQYPLLAKRLRQQGKVLVKFTLRRDGSVAAAELVATSEFESLNKAARDLIAQISGLKPFPDEVKKQQWVFVLPVEYRM